MSNILRNNKQIHILLLLAVTVIAFVLRIYKVDEVPPGLYVDEISIAVNAHSIVTKGVDEHGEQYPLFFEAFGEYKFPVYIYAAGISELFFGKSEFSVRFPSILFGSLTIPLVYLLTHQLFSINTEKKRKKTLRNSQYAIPTISAILLAISPWHLQFSRAGFEATVALFFFIIGVYFSVKFASTKQRIWIIVAACAYAISAYTYQAYRLTAPVMLCGQYVYLFTTQKMSKKNIYISAFIFALLLLPLLLFTFEAGGTERFAQTSAFGGQEEKDAWERFVIYSVVYINNYVSFFSPDFLFNYGDRIGRHQVPGFGLLYKWMIPCIILGIYRLITSTGRIQKYTILSLFALSPLAAALAVPSPHTLRTLLLIIPFSIVAAIGIQYISTLLKKKGIIIAILLISLFAIWETIYYFRLYYIHYPKVNILDWGGGKEKIAQEAEKMSDEYDEIVAEEVFGDLKYYFQFYTEDSKVDIVPNSWSKPDEWIDKDVLFIRTDYKSEDKEQVVNKIRIDNNNNDVVAEFWKL